MTDAEKRRTHRTAVGARRGGAFLSGRGLARMVVLCAAATYGCGDGESARNDGSADGGGNDGMTIPPVEGVVVNTPAGRVATDSADGYCDILEALTAATYRTTVRECANPKGSARVVLTAGATYPTGKTLRFDSAAAPGVELYADGGGTSQERAVIMAAEPWLLDPGDPPTSCLVHVSGGGYAQLSGVTLTQAPSLELTGACVTQGTFAMRDGRVTGFRHGGTSVTCFPQDGCDYDSGGSSMMQVANTLVDQNSTPGDGGGIYSKGFGATVHVYHSAIVNNTAAGSGGGLSLGGGWNTNIIRSSTVSGNSASTGGGFRVKFECSNTYVNVFSSTIANNTAYGTGGGLQFEPADLACARQDVTVYSSIIGGNHSVTTEEMNINSSWWTDEPMGDLGVFPCFGSSFIYVAPGLPRPTSVDLGCVTNTRDPRLGPLTEMGGTGNLPAHPLLPGSPALDVVGGDLFEEQRDQWIPDVDPPLPPSDAWTLVDRPVDGDDDGRIAPDVGAVEMNPRWQTELLAVAAKGAAGHGVVVTPPGFDRGAGTEYAAAGTSNEFVTYRLPIVAGGYYDLTVGVLQTPGGGTFKVSMASDASGPWSELGAGLDGFSASPTFAAFGPYRTPLVKTAGQVLLRFTVTGKNAASSGHRVSLDYVDARRSSAPCAARALALGANHSCAVTSAGGVRCWGSNDSGQLGDGAMVDVARAPAADALEGVATVATGAHHSCAVTTAGGVRCWGANDMGQLGEAGVKVRAVPPQKDLLTGVKAVAAGDNHTCVLTTGGGVRCWGANGSGQLGDGTTTTRSQPPSADVLSGVTAIAAGGASTCALMQQGGVRCWGANTFGLLGDGTTADRATPPGADVLSGVAAVSVGFSHACVVTTAGGLRCWGGNAGGQLGNGTVVGTLTPPSADLLTGVRDVAAGASFTCALMASGGVRCWGYNGDGQIGDDTPNSTERMNPPTTDILTDVAALGAGNAHVCARMKSGGVRCWGGNKLGQLGDGLAPDLAAAPPPQDIVQFEGTCR